MGGHNFFVTITFLFGEKYGMMIKVNTGDLLISEPFMHDKYFKRSVVLLSEQNKNNALGFILNKPTDLMVNEAISEFPEFDAPLFFGGPVETDMLFYLHTLGRSLKGSKKIADGIYWGGNFDILKMMIDDRKVMKNDIRFFAGYSGWDSDQLTNEIEQKSWLVSKSSPQFTFNNNYETLWNQVLKSMGNEFSMISNFPEDPSLN